MIVDMLVLVSES